VVRIEFAAGFGPAPAGHFAVITLANYQVASYGGASAAFAEAATALRVLLTRLPVALTLVGSSHPADAKGCQRAPTRAAPISLIALPRESLPLARPVASSSKERSLTSGDIGPLSPKGAGLGEAPPRYITPPL
jgi:hypothetical protein